MAHHPYPGSLRALTQEQVAALLLRLRQEAPRLVYLAAWTQYEVAGRIREVLHLDPGALGPTFIFVARLKHSTPSRVTASEELMRELTRLVETRDGSRSRYLFEGNSACHVPRKNGKELPCDGRHLSAVTMFRYVQAAGLAVGIDPGLCKTHVLRHSAITHVAELNKDQPINVTLRRLSDFSGHKNLQHLLHYLSNPREEGDFQKARSKAFGSVAAPPVRSVLPDYGVEVDETGNIYANGRRVPILFPTDLSMPMQYPFVQPSSEGAGLFLHHLVAEAFCGKRQRGMVVRHLDDDPFHVHRDNLRYGTQAENNADKAKRKLPPCRQCRITDEKHYRNPCTFCDAPDAPMVGQVFVESSLGLAEVPAFACSARCQKAFSQQRAAGEKMAAREAAASMAKLSAKMRIAEKSDST